jgi:uncharacterized membrane protein (Fun14 family)
MGFALKKDLQADDNYLGFRMFIVSIQLLERYGYVSTVNWDKLGMLNQHRFP